MSEFVVRQPACIAFSVTLLPVCDKGRVMTLSKKASGHDSPPGHPNDGIPLPNAFSVMNMRHQLHHEKDWHRSAPESGPPHSRWWRLR
jgi:hypothetical protein